uniref:EGF-like domain-containing protein n=1 Tax=Schistocephalus solidus TaxID=70667 RepID=A0A0V0J6I3_SCHSO
MPRPTLILLYLLHFTSTRNSPYAYQSDQGEAKESFNRTQAGVFRHPMIWGPQWRLTTPLTAGYPAALPQQQKQFYTEPLRRGHRRRTLLKMQMSPDHRCPRECECFSHQVYCRGQRGSTFPVGLPMRTARLSLFGFPLHRLEKANFDELPGLTQLVLSQNEIEEIEDGAFENLSNLQYLDLSSNWLTCLSANTFSGLGQLKSLLLSNNRIQRIAPESFDLKPNLQKLDLTGNPLTCDCYLVALKQRLASVGKLSIFSASSARCSLMDAKLPSSNVEKVVPIFCPDSALASLPPLSCLKPSCDSICSCHHGGYVSCTWKGLTTVPDDLPLNTTNLNLAGNKLKILRPGTFERYSNLRKLNLEGNAIEAIAPGTFKNLSHLSSLYLTSNRIKSITSDTFRELSSLTVLYLQRNEISCIDPEAFSAIPGLRILHLSDNKIETLDEKVFRRQRDLQFLYLIKNPWKCDCHLAWLPAYLKRREAGDNEWAVCRSPAPLEGTFVRNLTVGAMQCQNADDRAYSLRQLKCRAEKEGPQQMPQNQEPAADVHCPEKCTCSELAIRVQRSVNDVITLTASIPTFIESREPAIRVDCANVRLSVVPLGIPDNTKELYLNNNSLTAINRRQFSHLRQLEVLSLHDNNLECLASDTFADLVNLRVLLLHSNRLRCISNATFTLRKLEHVSFDENPFLCYCNMQWLPDWMRRNRHRIAISPYPPTCQSPPSLAGAPIVSLSANHFTCLELSQETIQESSRNVAEDGLQVGQTTLPTTPPLECSGAATVCCSERSSVCPKPTSCPKPCVCKNDQVDCSYNRLREVPLGIPEDTKDLFLEHNEITWIHSERIERLTKLETLILSYNSIMEIPPGLFTKLRKLKSLILNNNKIQCIHPQAFAGLKQLKVLILQSNDISTMENGTFGDLRELNNIALGQNPLHCDCNLQWLQNFFRTRFLDNGVAQCSTPKSMEFKSIFHAHPSNFTCLRLPPLAEAGGGLRLGALSAVMPATSGPISFADEATAHALAKCSPCTPNPCQGGGACQPVTSLRFTCKCKAPFYGDTCEQKMNACFGQPCRNGGTCKFLDDLGHYTCLCPRGFVGKNCDVNVNDCNPGICKNGGKCKDGINSYICECAPGFRGKHCEIKFKYCDDVNPCKNDGVCIKHDATDYGCVCQAGWGGKDCSENLDDCEYNQCQNGAVCLDQLNGYSCKCLHGYTGRFCDQAVEVYTDSSSDHSQLQKNNEVWLQTQSVQKWGKLRD